MSEPIYQLFVYGSLRSGFRNAAYEYLARYFSLVGEARVRAKVYDKHGLPVAVPTNEDTFIKGELYRLNNPAEFDWAMSQIDDYEGLNVEQGEVALYKRDLTHVFINGDQISGWIYWYTGPVTDYPELQVEDVLDYLQQRNKA